MEKQRFIGRNNTAMSIKRKKRMLTANPSAVRINFRIIFQIIGL